MRSVTLTVSVESVTVLQEVADLSVREESEPVTQWLRLTALQAGILIEIVNVKTISDGEKYIALLRLMNTSTMVPSH